MSSLLPLYSMRQSLTIPNSYLFIVATAFVESAAYRAPILAAISAIRPIATIACGPLFAI
jgi:hypothetical protein